MSNGLSRVRVFVVCFAVTIAFGSALTALAQSGRHMRKTMPVPIPAPEASPTPLKPAEKPKPMFTFIVGLDKYGEFSRVSLQTYSGVLRNCADRLEDSELVKAEIATRNMSRGDAILRAKSEKEAYVVWLYLRPNTFSGATDVNGNPNDVYIEYSVFAPTTAKLVTSGRTYPQAYRNKGVILSPKSSVIYGDYLLNQAAREAAERILAAFKIHPPADKRYGPRRCIQKGQGPERCICCVPGTTI